MPVRENDSVQEYLNKLAKAALQLLVLPNPVKRSIALEYVKMGVHGLCIILVLVAQAHVLDRGPVAPEGLEVSSADVVKAVLLDDMVQLYRLTQGKFISARAIQFTQAIDRESYGINLLLRLERPAFAVDAPIGPSEVTVPERAQNLVARPEGHLKVVGIPKNPVSRSEGPQYSGIQYTSPGCFRMEFSLSVNTSEKASFRVLYALHPKRKDVVG